MSDDNRTSIVSEAYESALESPRLSTDREASPLDDAASVHTATLGNPSGRALATDSNPDEKSGHVKNASEITETAVLTGEQSHSDDSPRESSYNDPKDPEVATQRVESQLAGMSVDGVPVDPENYQGPFKTYKRRWLGILSMALLNIANSWGWLTFAAISPYCAEFYNLSSESPINWLSIVILFAYLVSSPFVWTILIKKDTKWALIVCGTLSIIGNWIRYGGTRAHSFGAVMFGQIIIGFAQPFALNAPAFYTDIWFTSRSRISANAIASLANPLGGAIAELVGPAVVTKADELPTFVLITSIVSTVCALTALAVPQKPPTPACPSSMIPKHAPLESLKQLATKPQYWALWAMFAIYVGFFNAFSSFTAQIMMPYGYSSDEAGYAGAALILAGIVCCAIVSPIIDRLHHQLYVMYALIPAVSALYIGVIFMSKEDRDLAPPYVVCALLGALSFTLLPIFLEWCGEQFSSIDPAVTSSLMWMGGQLLGAIFIIIMNALKYNDDQGDPPGNMRRALIFEAVVACVGILPLWVVRKNTNNTRIEMDK